MTNEGRDRRWRDEEVFGIPRDPGSTTFQITRSTGIEHGRSEPDEKDPNNQAGVRVASDSCHCSMPKTYFLSQNYANRFSLETTIEYQLPKQSDVSITIYSLMGETMVMLKNDIEDAGCHQFTWAGTDRAVLFSKVTSTSNTHPEVENMKTVRWQFLVALLLVLLGAQSSQAGAGCGSNSGCGMSHGQSEQTTSATAKSGQYACPMHPEVVSDKPGKCFKCGMALEKVAGAGGDNGAASDLELQCQQLADQFADLQAHYDMMMRITDVEDLAPAMVSHRGMMARFAERVVALQSSIQLTQAATDAGASSPSAQSGHKH